MVQLVVSRRRLPSEKLVIDDETLRFIITSNLFIHEVIMFSLHLTLRGGVLSMVVDIIKRIIYIDFTWGVFVGNC